MGKSGELLLPRQRADKCVAEDFSDYFSSKISSIRSFLDGLAESRMSDYAELEASFLSLYDESCYLDRLSPVSVGAVTEIILSSPAKSCCLDPLPTPLLKKFLSVLAVPITKIVNASLASGLVLDSLKHAVITPLNKKSFLDPQDFSNYRPVSGLLFISKLIERVVLKQLTSHIEDFFCRLVSLPIESTIQLRLLSWPSRTIY